MTICHTATCKNIAVESGLYCPSCTTQEKRFGKTPRRMLPPSTPFSGSVNVQMQYLKTLMEYWKGEADFWKREAERLRSQVQY
jgi:hypothetical protein